ncbi:MAG: SIS domain-containing protein [Promethearchaeota archaeon]|nr:MAG: SIS domain-containing protein [Candidatus Lokiarchaeota archaeon]
MVEKTNMEQNQIEVNGKAKENLFRAMELMMKNLEANRIHLQKDKYFQYTQKFIELVYDGLINKRKFFLLASGRSAFILQAFSTRLVHLGASVYIVTNLASIPALSDKDILIILSGSGTTEIVVSLLKNYVNTVKPYGIVSITSHPESIIGRMGDLTIKLKGRTKRDKVRGEDAILTPEGTNFEIAAFVYLDSIIAELAVKMGMTNEDLLKKHAESI